MKIYSLVVVLLLMLIRRGSSGNKNKLKPSCTKSVKISLAMCELEPNDDVKFLRKQVPERNLNAVDRQIEHVLTLIKSLLIAWWHSGYTCGDTQNISALSTQNSEGSLEVIVFTNNLQLFKKICEEVESYDKKFTSILKLTSRPVSYPANLTWLRNLYAPCATLRVLLPEMLPEYNEVIYADTDVIFIRDSRYFWDHILTFNSTIGLSSYRYRRGGLTNLDKIKSRRMPLPTDLPHSGVMSPLMLMSLFSFRKTNFTKWLSTMKAYRWRIRNMPDETLLNSYQMTYPTEIQYTSLPFGAFTSSVVIGHQGLYTQPGFYKEIYQHFSMAKLNASFSIVNFVKTLRKKLAPFLRANKSVPTTMHTTPQAYRRMFKALDLYKTNPKTSSHI